jgi:hypothetical protein
MQHMNDFVFDDVEAEETNTAGSLQICLEGLEASPARGRADGRVQQMVHSPHRSTA